MLRKWMKVGYELPTLVNATYIEWNITLTDFDYLLRTIKLN